MSSFSRDGMVRAFRDIVERAVSARAGGPKSLRVAV